jgi:anti-sigma factor RsiW
MTEFDPYLHDDAAYVLGALDPVERAAFEAHLAGCAECSARVRELADVPDLLAGIDPAEFSDPTADPLPDTLLPGLLREARRRVRRQRTLVGSLAAVAAACVLALVIALWPASTGAPAARPFVAVGQSPVSASATLTATAWGTAIDVHCRYQSDVTSSGRYKLVAVDRSGARHQLGDWALPPYQDINYQAGTALLPGQIARLEITLPNGAPVLQLKT